MSSQPPNNRHIPVLINQVIEILNPCPGNVYIDATLGLGGHAQEILKHLGGSGAVYGIEADERNLNLAKENLSQWSNIHYIHENFENLAEIGEKILQKEGRVDGILFDLGLSSPHIEEADRGFSFQREGPLDMRFDTSKGITAADIVNTYPLEELINIFKNYGEEKFYYRIANQIVQLRKRDKFTTTTQLADAIRECVPYGHNKKHHFKTHPATRIFQALRIAANREIEVLQSGLAGALNVVSKHGRVIVISYHSIEDRIVKNFFKNLKHQGSVKILTKKPIRPERKEILNNRRSRSAKLRAAEKL